MAELCLKQAYYKYPTDKESSPELASGIEGVDLVKTCFEGAPITRLGIQAEPGTVMSINGSKIVMGPTGTYELDNAIKVTSLIFEREQPFLRRVLVDAIYLKGE